MAKLMSLAAASCSGRAAPLRRRQRAFAARLAVRARQDLLTGMEPGDRARLRSCGGVGAGIWAVVAPAQPWLALSDEDYRIAARYRLGLPLREGGGACFSLWLPWSSPQASEADGEAPTAFAETPARTSTETAPSRVA